MNILKEHYHKLKGNLRLLLLYEAKLNAQHYFYSRHFRKQMRQRNIVDELLLLNLILAETYRTYQDLLFAIETKNKDCLLTPLHANHPHISSQMKTAFKTLKKYETYLLNMMDCSYTNGVIKRTAFSFRSFYHFKAKLLYIQTISLAKKRLKKELKSNKKIEVA